MYPLIMMCCPQSNSCAQLRQACNLGCNFVTCDMWDCSFDKKTAQLSPQSDLAADLANLRQLSGARLTEESPKKWLGQILGRVWTRACKWTSWGRYSWTGWQTSRRIESSSDVAFYILCHLSYYNNSFWLIYSYKGSCFVNFLSSSIFGDEYCGFRYNYLLSNCHLSPVSCLFVTCHLSLVICHLSPVTCLLSLVTCTCYNLLLIWNFLAVSD